MHGYITVFCNCVHTLVSVHFLHFWNTRQKSNYYNFVVCLYTHVASCEGNLIAEPLLRKQNILSNLNAKNRILDILKDLIIYVV